jgi:hypothetical protein
MKKQKDIVKYVIQKNFVNIIVKNKRAKYVKVQVFAIIIREKCTAIFAHLIYGVSTIDFVVNVKNVEV